MNDYVTKEELEQIEKRLMRAYNELCKIQKILKQKGSDDDGKRETPRRET